jgi:hypothetical protein
MGLKTGMRLYAQNSSCEVIVVKTADTVVSLSCAGLEMLPAGPAGAAGQVPDGPLVQLGKRYTDDDNQVEILCTKAGAGPLAVDGQVLSVKTAKPLPASD